MEGRWNNYFRDSLGLDVRSLALFRIAYGLCVAFDIALRMQDLSVYYTDAGLWPRGAALAFDGAEAFSVHFAFGGWFGQFCLLSLQCVIALLLAVGYRTRLMTLLTCVLLNSLHWRTSVVVHGGDAYLRVFAFWAMFLPLGARWSVDSYLRNEHDKSPGHVVFSSATAFFTLQLLFIYCFTSVLKSAPAWRDEYSAVYMALNLDHFATPLAIWLRNQDQQILSLMTVTTLYWEGFGPALAFFPVFRGVVRTLLVFAFIGMHVSFGVFLDIGVFSWAASIVWLALLPSWFWLQIERRWGESKRWERCRVVLHGCCKRLERLSPGASYWRPRRWEQLVLWLSFVCVVIWNVSSLYPAKKLPEVLKQYGAFSGLRQHWGMFAPHPTVDDGWWVIPAERLNGEVIDLWANGAAPTAKKPLVVSQTYPSQRWRKYMLVYYYKSFVPFRGYLFSYLCRQWNRGKSGDARIWRIRVDYFLEKTTSEGIVRPKPVTLYTGYCREVPKGQRPQNYDPWKL